MSNEIYELTKIFTKDDIAEKGLPVDARFRHLTITVQPLNLTGSPDLLETDKLLVQGNAVNNATGTVTLQCVPPNTFRKYDLGTENVIDLANPHFINTNAPIKILYADFATIVGCTHLAISVIGFID